MPLKIYVKAKCEEQIKKIDDKILSFGTPGDTLAQTIDKVQDEFDIKGIDTEITKYGDEIKGADGEGTGEIETEVVAKIDAEQLNANGINSADYPDNQWVTDNAEKLLDAGLTQEHIDELQRLQGLERAIKQDEYLGVNISANTSIQTGDYVQAEDVPEKVEVGQVFKSSMSKTLEDGTEYGGFATVSVEGVDADGNPVYQIKSATIMPNSMTDELSKALENLPDDLSDKIWDDVLTPIAKGSMERDIDTTLQKVAQATAAVAIGGALAGAEVVKGKPEQGELDLKGGQGVKNTEAIDYTEAYAYLFEQYVSEAPPAQGELPLDNPNTMANKLKKGALGAGSSLLKTVNKGIDAVGKAATTGIQKGVQGVKDAGKQLANKVTKEKLMKAWKTAGSPTDTGSIMNILSDNGFADEQIISIGQSNKVELKPTTAPADEKPADDAPVDANNDGKDDATGDPMPVDANNDGKDDNTGEPMPQPKDATQAGSASTAKPNPKIKVAPGAGQMAKAKDGQDYIWAGAQWINNSTAKMATKDVAAELGNPVLKTLADEIKKAGVQAEVKAMLTGAKAPPGGKPAPKV